MKFRIKTDEMQVILNQLSSVAKLSEDGVLGMVLVTVDDNIVFSATNGVISIVIVSDTGKILESGKALFKLKDIKSYITKFIPFDGSIGTDVFEFDFANNGVIKSKTKFVNGKLSNKRLKFDLYNPEMFPIIKIDKQIDLILNSTLLKDGINRTIQYVNPLEMRKALSGLCVRIHNDRVVFVGTSGIKLAEYVLPVETIIEDKIVIFNYGLAYTLKNLLDIDRQVFMKFGARYAHFRFDNVYLVGALIIGESYPDYKNIISNTEAKYIFPKDEVHDVLKSAVSVLDSEDDNKVVFKFDGTELDISSTRLNSKIELDSEVHSPALFAVNGVELESILRNFMRDDLDLYIGDSGKFILIESNHENYRALLTTLKTI